VFPVIVFFIERNNRNLHVTDSDLFFKTMTRHFSFLFPWGQEGREEGEEKGRFGMMNGDGGDEIEKRGRKGNVCYGEWC
jgi:hypothetical protein